MSRDSILDDAIAKAKADGDVELAEWLRITRGAEKAVRWYTTMVKELEDFARRLEECAKRREPVTLFGVDYVASDENHRLLEVVRALLVCDDDDTDAHGCPMYDEHAEGRCRLDAALVELGIEAD